MSEASFKSYPRGIPFQPPAALTAREARLRRWTYGLAASAALLLVLMTAGSVFLHKYLQTRAGETSPAADNQRSLPAERPANATKAGDPDKPPAGPPAAVLALQKELEEKEKALAEREKGIAQKEAKARANTQGLLQTVGILTVGHLYESFVGIGLLADARESKVYKKDEAERMLDELVNNLNVVDAQLRKLLAGEVSTEDKKAVEHVRELNNLLKVQARELKAYWADPSPEQARKNRQAREAAWAGIKPLLPGGDQD